MKGSSSKKNSFRIKLMMGILCDLVVLLTSVLDFYRNTFILVIYIHVFLVFKSLVKRLDRKSSLFAIFEVLVTQVLAYVKASIYISMILAAFILLMSQAIQRSSDFTDDTRFVETAQSVGPITGHFLAWVFDNDWFALLKEFEEGYSHRPYVFAVAISIVLFIVHAFFKNILTKFFLSVVIGSKT